ncbi:MAG TPA: trigger factor [Caldilineaceae bacterium]|nr:trigger factor [Caldilineaceae bacterium]
MSLQITKEERENRELLLTIEVDQSRVDQELRKAARKVAANYRIPGFRKGKAPYHVIVQQVGLPALYNEFLEDLGQQVYMDALKQEELEPYARGSLEDVSLEPLTYKLVMPMDPEIDLGAYRELRVDEPAVEVNEDDVDAQLNQYREQHASWEEVDRPTQYGDRINIDVHSVIPAEEEGGEEIVVFDETDWEVTPDEENPMEPAGFDEALLGLTPGEEKEFDLTWPEDSKSLHAGKTAHFQVKVNSIEAYVQPELNDEFAQLIGPDYETIDDLKNSIRDSIREQAKAQADNEYLEQVLDKMLEGSTLNYPPVVIEDQIDSMLNDIRMQLQRFGIQDMDFYYRQTGQSEAQMRESLREDAVKQAERNLIISEILRTEELAVSDEEFEERVAAMTQGDDSESTLQLAEFLRSESGRSILESQLLRDKAIERVLAIARGQADALDAANAEAADATEENAAKPEATEATEENVAGDDATETPAAGAVAGTDAATATADDMHSRE